MSSKNRGKLAKRVFKHLFIPLLVLSIAAFSIIFYKEKQYLKKKTEIIYRNKYTNIIELYLSSSLKHLNSTAKDWALWNDTYNFVINRNKEYIQDNFPGNTLPNLNIDYMLFFNKEKLVFGVKSKDIPINKNPLGFTPHNTQKGFIRINRTIYFYTSSYILPSNGKGKPHGIIVILKKLSLQRLKKDIEDIKLGKVITNYKTTTINGIPIGVSYTNKKEYIVLLGIQGKPVGSIVFPLQPKILAYVYRFISVGVFGLAIIFIILSTGLIYFGITKYFSKKVKKLSKRIENIPADLELFSIENIEEEFKPIIETVIKLVDRIKESEYIFEKVADILPAGIIICKDTIVYSNKYAKELLKDNLIGRNITELLNEQDSEIFAKNIEKRRKGEQFTTNHILKLKTHPPLIIFAVSTTIKYKGEFLSLSTFVDVTDIFNLKEKYKRIVENLPYGVIHKRIEIENNKPKEEIILYISKDIENITLYEEEEIDTFEKWEKYIVSGKIDKMSSLIKEGISDIEYRMRRKDGKIIWIKDVAIVLSKNKNTYEILNLIEEITKRKKISMFYQTLYKINAVKVRANDEKELLNSICTTLAVTCAFKTVRINKIQDGQEKPLFEYGEKDKKEPMQHAWIYPSNNKNSIIYTESYFSPLNSATVPIIVENNMEYTLTVHSDIFSLFDDEFLDLLKQLAEDIGDTIKRIRYRKQLIYEFYHDRLTGLKNLTSLIKDSSEINKGCLIYLRINNPFTLNQIYGIEFSNKILKRIGDILTETIKNGTVYRIFGNRFAVLVPEETNKEKITGVVHVIENHLSEITLEGNKIPIGWSIGVSIYPDLVSHKKDIISSAEAALTRAQKSGKLEFYSEEMRKEVEEHFKIGNYLKKAIAEHKFFFYYQPILDLRNNKIVKGEALIRLKDEEGKFISPETFISLAEQMNLIEDITRIVIKDVLRETEAIPNIDIALNISAKDMGNSNLIELIKTNLKETNRTSLSIEITERDIVENIQKASTFIKELRNLGVKVEIDDFGVKYSSLNRLIEIDFDVIKIDKTIIDLIGQKKANQIIAYIINLAHSLGAEVQAEGVETDNQFEFLRFQKCDYIQGYFISKPLPFKEFLSFIRRYNR